MLVTDIAMPGDVDGARLAALAAERHPDMEVAVMTGFTDRAQALSARFPVFAKPVDIAALVRHIEQRLAEREARKANDRT